MKEKKEERERQERKMQGRKRIKGTQKLFNSVNTLFFRK